MNTMMDIVDAALIRANLFAFLLGTFACASFIVLVGLLVMGVPIDGNYWTMIIKHSINVSGGIIIFSVVVRRGIYEKRIAQSQTSTG
mgnify:CR=1 FL=1